MVFNTERRLIRIAAILGIVGIVMVALMYISMNALKNLPEMREAIEASGQTLEGDLMNTTYFILTALSILVVIALFVIANKLTLDNHKMMGIILIVLGVLSFWLLWFVPIILMIIAGILILVNGKKYLNRHEDQNIVNND